jgi:hypothetical protein
MTLKNNALAPILVAIVSFSAAADNQPLRFEQACASGPSLSIAAVGDIIPHQALQNAALGYRGGFRDVWSPVANLLSRADVTYGNLEGPAANGLPLTDRQMIFNFSPRVLSDLLAGGFDVISTANNHSMDRGSEGANRTVENAERAGLPQTGLRRRGDDRTPWHTITREGGFTLAWIACTYGTNGMPDPHRQALNCYSQTSTIEREINELSSDSRIDAVIVTPHWGTERASSPGSREKALARRFFQAGALAVLGSHPHVLQTWEKVVVNGRERFVAYSLGNFVSNQLYYGVAQRTGTILYLGLTRTREGTVVNGVKHTPTYGKRDPFRVYAYDRLSSSERSQVLGHTRRYMSAQNELGSEDHLVTNPECR